MFLKSSDRLAIVDFENNQITHKDLVQNIQYLSSKIPNINGKNVILCMENRKEWIYSFFAIWNKKAVPVVLDAQSSTQELEYFISDSDAKIVIASNENYENVYNAIKNLGLNIDVLNIDNILFENIGEQSLELQNPEGDDTAIILYTSGTTSMPKGVMLTMNNIQNEILSIADFEVDNPDQKNDQTLSILPYHHILPLMINCLYFLYREYSIVLVKKLNSANILNALEKNRITFFVAVPRVYKLFYTSIKNKINSSFVTRLLFKLAKKVNNKTFSKIIFSKVHKMFGGKIKYLLAGGAKSDLEMIEFFNTLGFQYCEGYGLTETSPVFLGSIPKNYKPGTVGKPVFNVETKVVDDELWVRGPIVMKGYYKKPEKTKEAITEDGWFKTGDLVNVDSNGYITILGRKNSMIVLSNGKNVDPEGLEEKLLLEYKFGVSEVAILNHNDKLSALIVVDTKDLQKNGIYNISTFVQNGIEFYNAKAHNYTKILEYKIIESELPKTRLGKIQRFKLSSLFTNQNVQKEEKIEKPSNKEYLVIEEYIENLKNIKNIHPDDKFEIELGLDSLDLVELITYIDSHFNVKLNEKDLSEYNTIRKLSNYLSNESNGYSENGISLGDSIKDIKEENIKKGILIPILRPIVWLLMKIYFRLTLKNKDKLPKDGPRIYISNHQSFVDALAIANMVDNNTYFVAIDLYFNSKIMSWFAKNANVIVINIESNVKESIQTIANVLKQGKKVVIFPEGTRTKDGQMLPFKKVFAILAKELNVPIEVLKIDGAYQAMSRHMVFPRPKKITVSYLGTVEPIGEYDQIVKTAEDMYKIKK